MEFGRHLAISRGVHCVYFQIFLNETLKQPFLHNRDETAVDGIVKPSIPIHHGEHQIKKNFLLGAASALFLASAASFAQVPAGAPAGSTGACKDGPYTSNETKKGACTGHKVVKDWYAADAAPGKASSAKEMTPATASNATAAPSEPGAATTPMKPKAMTKSGDTAKVAEGGGPGNVWVNASPKVYHCPGTKYYGTTKERSYMTEAEAKTVGAHADHGKACT